MLKVVWVSNYSIEIGRGPMFRLMNMMEPMSKMCELSLFSFGSFDDYVKEYASILGINCYESACVMDGWHVVNANAISEKVLDTCREIRADLVVLTWEIWDLAVSLFNTLKESNVKFITIVHSIPFAGMPVRGTVYEIDIIRRIINEDQWKIKGYLAKNFFKSKNYLLKIPFLTMTPTVENRFKSYFKKINLYCAYPGYAVNLSSQNSAEDVFKYEMAFMARFEKGKGIYDLIRIILRIKKNIPKVKIVMIGSFTFPEEEKYYKSVLSSYDLINNFVFVGWQNGKEKIDYLRASKLFVYPSFTGDTFSISLLEALSVGRKIVCYDAPYVRDNYYTLDDVYAVKTHNIKGFASICCDLLSAGSYYSDKNVKFVENNYSDWRSVSESEFSCYLEYLADCEYI